MAPPLPVLPPAGSDAGGQGGSISNQIADDLQHRQHHQHRQQQFNTDYRDPSTRGSIHTDHPRPPGRVHSTEPELARSGTNQRLNNTPSTRGENVPLGAEYPQRDDPGSNTPMDNVARGGRRDLPEDTENSTMHRTERTNPTSTTPGLRTPLSPRLEVQDWPGDAINVNLQPLGSSNTQRPTRRLNVAGSGTVGQRGKAEGSDGQVRQGKGAEQGVEAEWQMRDAGLGVRRASDRLDNLEAWRSRLQPGSHLDVKDTVDKWCEAEVLTVDNALGRVFITYTYWSSKVRRIFMYIQQRLTFILSTPR